MSAGPEHDHEQSLPAGQPAPAKQGLRAAWLGSRRAAVLAGVVSAGLLAGAGVAFAATGSPTHPAAPKPATAATPSPSAPAPSAPAQEPLHHRFPFRLGPMFGAGPAGLGGLFGALHGQYVAPKSGGGYQTIDFQNGKVTAVSSTSITLRSADGYTHSYAVTSSTLVNAQRGGISSIKTGHEASVQATVSGGTATAASIEDLSLLQQGFHKFFGSLPDGNFKKFLP